MPNLFRPVLLLFLVLHIISVCATIGETPNAMAGQTEEALQRFFFVFFF